MDDQDASTHRFAEQALDALLGVPESVRPRPVDGRVDLMTVLRDDR
jgi:hypothetical protein